MRPLVLAAGLVVVLLLALHRPAAAAGCLNCGPKPPVGSSGPARDSFLVWGTVVNTTFTAFDVFHQLRYGRRNPKVTGMQLVFTVPVLVYGINFVKVDSHDWAGWALTVWSAGLFVHGALPVIASKFETTVDSEPLSFHIAPTPIIGWDDNKPRAGLSISGTF